MITEGRGKDISRRELPPIHPGGILLEEFLVPLGLSQYRLAKDTSVPPRRINGIVRGARAVSADTALRLDRYFGTSECFWLNLQAHHDLAVEKGRLGDRLSREVKVLTHSALSTPDPGLTRIDPAAGFPKRRAVVSGLRGGLSRPGDQPDRAGRIGRRDRDIRTRRAQPFPTRPRRDESQPP
jgi:addiction module HigA family antidote